MDSDPIHEIRKLLRLRMNGEVSANMRARGINYKINFGLDAMSIRDLAKRYNPDRSLAERLWEESSREGKILATLLYPRPEFTSNKADEWVDGCFTVELGEQLCFNLLQHLPFASEKSLEWIKDNDENKKSFGYLLLLRLILGKKKLPDLSFVKSMAEKDRNSESSQLALHAIRFLENIDNNDVKL